VKPNIVFVLADDMGFNDVGWNNPHMVTPYMDDLAANGIILDRNYVAPVCSPTRGALMSGKYTHRIGMQHSVIMPQYAECLDLDITTLGQKMQELNYATHYVGKWHLGFCDEACLPTSRGFDTFYGFYNAFIDHYTHECYGGYDLWDNGVVERSDSFAADLFTQRAVNIINEHDASKPLYLFVSEALVHNPVQVPPGFEASNLTDFMAAYRANYESMVKYLDQSVGKIVDALKESGLYENTIFVFSSDNGAQIGSASSAPLRGAKSSLWEGGTRVPGFVHSPLQTRTGIRSQETMYVTDWFSTFAHLGGGCTDGMGLDSFNQHDLILNGGRSVRNEFIYNLDDVTPQMFGMAAFRMGDYKLVTGYPGMYDGWEGDAQYPLGYTYDVDTYGVNTDAKVEARRARMGRGDTDAMIEYANKVQNRALLFNVMDDPEERHDLSAEKPELLQLMSGRLMDLYNDVEPAHIYHDIPEADPANYGGVWTPGWCPWLVHE